MDNAVVIAEPRATGATVSESELIVALADGRTISVPVAWYPRLLHAAHAERAPVQVIGDGEGLYWPQLDLSLSVESLLAGRRSREPEASLREWKERIEERRAALSRGEEPPAWAPEQPLPEWWDEADS